MTRPPAPRYFPRYYRGLDGVRALAVLAVLIYHVFPQGIVRGGFIGVDVFFVVSGFLITTLLLRELSTSENIDLLDFWKRRARRLLPALGVMLAVCSAAAGLIGGDILTRLGLQLLSAATFSYNWVSIADGSSYFASTTPELFQNLWSLAVEEQFYVAWPVLLPLFLLLPRVRHRVILAVALSILSGAWMVVLLAHGSDLTRAYFGTDSHGFGLLLGAAVAFALPHMHQILTQRMPPLVVRQSIDVAGGIALVSLIALACLPEASDALAFPAVLWGASALTVVVIAAVSVPDSILGSLLETRLLRWLGQRSYALYLWHWPVLLLVLAGSTGSLVLANVSVPVSVFTVIITVTAAALSYRWVEMPVRKEGFRAVARKLGDRLRSTPARRFGAVSLLAASAMVLAGVSGALIETPRLSSGAANVAAGALAVSQANATRVDASTLLPRVHASPAPALIRASAEQQAAQETEAMAERISGEGITAVGDSVMLASAPALLAQLPGIAVDAEVSRSLWAGAQTVENLAASGQLRDRVVIALATNGPIDVADLTRISDAAGPTRDIVLVNAFAPREWIPGVNAELDRYATTRPNVIVADWSGAIESRVDLLADDQIHPGEEGGALFTEVVLQSLAALDVEQLMRASHNRANDERLR